VTALDGPGPITGEEGFPEIYAAKDPDWLVGRDVTADCSKARQQGGKKYN
jgi:hypothetical protein